MKSITSNPLDSLRSPVIRALCTQVVIEDRRKL